MVKTRDSGLQIVAQHLAPLHQAAQGEEMIIGNCKDFDPINVQERARDVRVGRDFGECWTR